MSSALPWFRMYSRIMTDTDVEFLAFEDQRHYVWLLCMKNEGYLDKNYARDQFDRMIGRKLGLQGDALVACKSRIMEVGLIDENWQPRNWDDLQFKSDSSKDRVKKYRENRKIKKQEGVERFGNVTVTAQEKDTEKDKKINTSEPPVADNSNPAKITKQQHEKIIALYHEILPELSNVLVSRWHGSKNAAALAARWREDASFRSEEFWRAFFESVRLNPWWMKTPDDKTGQSWNGCNLAWLVKRENFDKVLELGSGS